MEFELNPAKIGIEMENCIDFILEGEWSEEKQMMAIAFEEAYVNVCKYAYEGREQSYLRVSIRKYDDHIEADLWDEGMPYNPISVPLGEIVEGQIGGHGLRLMREYCELQYERVGNLNHLQMRKQL